MELVEVRDLDGPNLFMLVPAIKIELALWPEGQPARDGDAPTRIGDGLSGLVERLHAATAQPAPTVAWRAMDTDGVWSFAFSWDHRRFALRIAAAAVAHALGEAVDESAVVVELGELLTATEVDDRPLWIRDRDRAIPIVGVTGTNGKTTTTRLLAHLLRSAGWRVGWSSSSGVYIEGEEVLTGDYSGPSGARRVLAEPGLDVAVLETARGGILLRGLAYESNDVGVFINVSADHLDLHGIRTLESLAEVKGLVVGVTREDGTAVLNADDPRVLAAAGGIRAKRLLVSRHAENAAVAEAVAAGERVLIATDGRIVFRTANDEATVATIADIPMTFGGKAQHMIENALCASGAALGLGVTPARVGEGLRSFRNTAEQNLGRLNVYDVGGVIVILDFAHNEAGLEQLLGFAEAWREAPGRLITIVGSAGDRTDQSLIALGRIAAERSDVVIAKGTVKYLRGRTLDELIGLYSDGVASSGREVPYSVVEDEYHGMLAGIEAAERGDVVAIMCHEQTDQIVDHLEAVGSTLS